MNARPAPRITVAIPNENTAQWLPGATESVLAQRFGDFELLVLDNASTDECLEIARRYRDPRIVLHVNERNLGFAGNLHDGCRLPAGARRLCRLRRHRRHPGVRLPGRGGGLPGRRAGLRHGAWPRRLDRHGRPSLRRVRPVLGAHHPGGRGDARRLHARLLLHQHGAAHWWDPRDEARHEVFDLWLFCRMCLAGDIGPLDRVLVYRGLGSDAAGLAQAGLFAGAIACIKIASGCVVDPGDVAVMRRAPGLLRSDPAAAHRLLRAALPLRLAAGLVAAAAWLAALLLAPAVAPPVPGDAYAQGVPLLLWLLAGTLFWLAVAPLTMVAAHAPARTAMMTIGHSVTLVAGGLVRLPLHGALGTAQAVCRMRVVVALVVLAMAHRLAAPTRVWELPGDDGSWAGIRR